MAVEWTICTRWVVVAIFIKIAIEIGFYGVLKLLQIVEI
jgi:hypothetical protein